MGEDLKSILEKLSRGELSVAEAEKAIGDSAPFTRKDEQSAGADSGNRVCLKILVDKPGKEPVTIRMPFFLPRLGPKTMELIPSFFRSRLSQLGVNASDLSAMQAQWGELLRGGSIEVEQGLRKVKIFVES